MRALIVTSIGVACAGALLLPLAPTESADSALSGRQSATDEDAAPPAARTGRSGSGGPVPGHTQSLPLGTPATDTRSGDKLLSAWEDDPSGGKRAASTKVKPFSLVGVVWDDAGATPRGQLQVQTRSSDTDRWSAWRSLETPGGHGPDPGAREQGGGKALGATTPLWTGESSAVRVRIVPEAKPKGTKETKGEPSPGQQSGKAGLPRGARLELVAPGQERGSSADGARSDRNPQPGTTAREDGPEKQPGGVLPALSKAETTATYGDEKSDSAPSAQGGAKDKHIGPRPDIVTRKGWGADEGLREKGFPYGRTVKSAVVHHSAETTGYDCADVPSIIRGIYRYHVKSSNWRDLGYNFLVDKCGKIYEGRAGGVARAVTGAHTLGFNGETTGIAVLGTYSKDTPSKQATGALARLTAWKLGVHGVDARGKVTLTSAGGTKHKKGAKVSFNAVSGHRDGFVTDCPGDRLYGALPGIRTEAGKLQGR